MKSLWSRRLLGIPIGIILVIVLGVGVYAYNTVVNSTVTGSITVNPYVPVAPITVYEATASPLNFTGTVTAGEGGNAVIDLTGAIIVTDMSTNGELVQISDISVSGTLPNGLVLTADTVPVYFVNRLATVDMHLTGNLPAGTYNLGDGSPSVHISCN